MIRSSCEQITPVWLTEILTTNGTLQHGSVSQIFCDTTSFNKGYVSNIARLILTYSEGASGVLPGGLFLKTSKPDVHVEYLNIGRHEIQFYQAMQHFSAPPVAIPHCYEAQFDPTNGHSHLLLADLSGTHFQRPLPIPPSNHHCEMIMDSLAQLHAFWWNHPLLGNGLGERLTQERGAQIRQRLEATLPQYFDYLGDALLPTQRETYERILASSIWDRSVERLCSLQQVTLVHGDLHTGNLMLPRNPDQDRVMLIDWHLWNIHIAANDLAFLIALHWSPQRRAALEQPLLHHYHRQLTAYGIDYSWDALWQDYRESVIEMVLIPIGQFRRNSPAGVIWFGLQDSMSAFDDLHCSELL